MKIQNDMIRGSGDGVEGLLCRRFSFNIPFSTNKYISGTILLFNEVVEWTDKRKDLHII
jgi:hypothetical protein